jgi:hypothetical protein
LAAYELTVENLRAKLAQANAGQQQPVARVRFNDDAFDSVDWIQNQGMPLKDGDFLYTHPAPQTKPQPPRTGEAER